MISCKYLEVNLIDCSEKGYIPIYLTYKKLINLNHVIVFLSF